MNRRTLLGRMSGLLATVCAAVVGVPAVRFLIAPLYENKSKRSVVQRVARLDQLRVGEPVQFNVLGSRRDAWTLYPKGNLGIVWLVRRTSESTAPQDAKVDAYSAECPHLGCTIQRSASKAEFDCPCHKAVFDFSGDAVDTRTRGYVNPAPRSMDALTCHVVSVSAGESKEWWVEVEYQRFKAGLTTKIPVV